MLVGIVEIYSSCIYSQTMKNLSFIKKTNVLRKLCVIPVLFFINCKCCSIVPYKCCSQSTCSTFCADCTQEFAVRLSSTRPPCAQTVVL